MILSRKITIADLRNNCGDKNTIQIAKFWPGILAEIKEQRPKKSDYLECCSCCEYSWIDHADRCAYPIFYWLLLIGAPIFTFCKILQALFPYMILGYLLYHQQLLNIDLFQLAMLFTCIGLQFILLILSIMVFRLQYWLWHIYPGREVTLDIDKPANTLMVPINEWYTKREWIPCIQKLLSELYGEDVATLIMDYYQQIKLNSIQTI